jgi:hypothetical protein
VPPATGPCRLSTGRVIAIVDAGATSGWLGMYARPLHASLGASLPWLGMKMLCVLMLEPFDFSLPL